MNNEFELVVSDDFLDEPLYVIDEEEEVVEGIPLDDFIDENCVCKKLYCCSCGKEMNAPKTYLLKVENGNEFMTCSLKCVIAAQKRYCDKGLSSKIVSV